MTTREMTEQCSSIIAEMRAIHSAAGGTFTPEQAEKYDALNAKFAEAQKNVARAKALEDAERRMQGTPVHGSGDNRFDESCREFSLTRAIAGAAGLRVDDGREKEVSQELAKRAGRPVSGLMVPMSIFHKPVERRTIATDSPVGGPGSNLIQTSLDGSQTIDMLRQKLVMGRLGARVISGLVGNVDLPKQTAATTAGWVAEDSGLSLDDAEFSKVSLTPKHVGCLTEYSRNMLLQTTPDIEMLLRSDFAAQIARAIDNAAIGSNPANGPDGILQASGVDLSTTMGASPTWAKVLALIELTQLDNAEGSAFLTHPSVVRKLRSTVKVSSTDSVMIQQEPNSLAGYPLVSVASSALFATAPTPDEYVLLFGNFSDVLIGYWDQLSILVNPYESSAYAKGNVQVRGMATCDVAIRHGESFAGCDDIQV